MEQRAVQLPAKINPNAKNGGARPGSGRKPFGRNKRRIPGALLEELMETEETPFHVMINNMRFWHRACLRLTVTLEEKILALGENAAPDEIKDLTKTMVQVLEARSQSEKCAVDAAPYIHPRLANIQIEQLEEKVAEDDASTERPKTLQDAMERFQTRILRPVR